MYELRPYQSRTIDQAVALIASGIRRFVMQLPTGGGKTVIASEIIRRALLKGSRLLFAAHRLELLDQPYTKLTDAGIPEEKIGIIRSGERKRRRPNAPVQIASIASLAKRNAPSADIVFVDEAHRAAATSYAKLLKQYPDAVIAGLTATPSRLDGKGLRGAFDEILVAALPSELIADGWIVNPWILTIPPPDLSEVKHSGFDFDHRSIAAVFNKKHLIGDIVDHWLEHAKGLRTIAFAASVEHSQNITQMFIERGVRARHVDGSSSEAERRDAVQALREHRIDVLSNCELYIEGLDVPEAKCIIMARPTESRTIYLQSCGRIMRPYQGIRAVILDHAGNARRHGAPSEDHVYSLDAKPSRGSGMPLLKACGGCGGDVPLATRFCEHCGFEFVIDTDLKIVAGKLVEFKKSEEDEKRELWDRLWAKSWEEGHHPQWVVRKYQERYGDPPATWKEPERPKIAFSEAEKRDGFMHLSKVAHINGYGSDWIAKKYKIKFQEEVPTGSFADRAIEAQAKNTGAASTPAPQAPALDLVEGEL